MDTKAAPMTMGVGNRLRVYELVAELGAGGMGVVYRARDSKLGRDVALKILPALFADNLERLARFEREAQTLAKLNHVNIAQIYGVEDAGGVRALVMELVGGRTLEDALGGGAMALEEAIPIACQIADALDAAHEQGIVHRDLKPANIKIRDDGTVKVLDFGLAKALAPSAEQRASSDVDLTKSPTMITPLTTPLITELGVIIGTAAYMSPEQARGHSAGTRADIWAFGVVLFEMLAGRRLFEGETVSDLLAAVLREEIPWHALPASTPASVRWVLERCLERDPRMRLGHIGEAAFILRHPDRARPAVGVSTARARRIWPWWLGAGLLAGGGLAAVVLSVGDRATLPSAVYRMSFEVPRLDRRANPVQVSADGSRLFIASAPTPQVPSRILTRAFDGTETAAIPGTEGVSDFFVSPDGTQVAFVADGALRRLPISGGRAAVVAPISGIGGGHWSKDDHLFVAARSDPGLPVRLLRVPAAGGQPETILEPFDAALGAAVFYNPKVLPDGRHVLYVASSAQGPRIEALDLQSKSRRTVAEFQSFFDVIDAGALITVDGEGRVIWTPFDLKTATVSGTPVPLGVQLPAGRAIPKFQVSSNGTLVYLAADVLSGSLGWLAPAAAFEPVTDLPTGAASARVSPDGRQATWVVPSAPGTSAEITLFDFALATKRRLALGSGAVWTAAGTVLFNAPGGGLAEVSLEIGALPREAGIAATPLDVASDGQLLLVKSDPGSLRTLLRARQGPNGVTDVQTVISSSTALGGARISPDRRWMAYAAGDVGTAQIFIRRLDRASRSVPVTPAGVGAAVWSRDGRTLFYQDADGTVKRVALTLSGEDVRVGVPSSVSGEKRVTLRDIGPDGRLLVSDSATPLVDHVAVVVGLPELARRSVTR